MQEYVKVCYEFIDPIIADTLAKKHKQRRLELDAKDGVKEVKEGETLLENLVNYTESRDLRFTNPGLIYWWQPQIKPCSGTRW